MTDSDVQQLLSMKDVVEEAFKSKAANALVSPPRFHVDIQKGSLVFTAGAEVRDRKVIGLRVYDTFHSDSKTSTDKEQLVSVFDSETGNFKGVVIGNSIGAMRTGALGGVAIKYLSSPESNSVGIIGSGFQARTQLMAACAVRDIKIVKVFSPNEKNRDTFASEMSESLSIVVKAVSSAEEAVRDADILICATSSNTPVFEAGWLKDGVHINTVGPKLINDHEISVETAEKCQIICTDSLTQLDAYNPPYFLRATTSMERVIDLSEIVAGRKSSRASLNEISLFLSVGLSGTEVLVADAAIIKANQQDLK